MPTVSFDKDYAIAGLKNYFAAPEFVAAFEALKHGFKIGLLFALIKEGLVVVEKLAHDVDALGSGAVKKDALVSYIDDCIHMWGPLEMIDGPLISKVVDAMILWYNTIHGHDWFLKVDQRF